LRFLLSVSGKGAGLGNLEVVVNGGRVSSHISSVSSEETYEASFIPHEEARCRVDVKFNGEKVPNSPWFVEVRVESQTYWIILTYCYITLNAHQSFCHSCSTYQLTWIYIFRLRTLTRL
jgi:hypothetical protein